MTKKEQLTGEEVQGKKSSSGERIVGVDIKKKVSEEPARASKKVEEPKGKVSLHQGAGTRGGPLVKSHD